MGRSAVGVWAGLEGRYFGGVTSPRRKAYGGQVQRQGAASDSPPNGKIAPRSERKYRLEAYATLWIFPG